MPPSNSSFPGLKSFGISTIRCRTYGHDIGDQVLVAVARNMQEAIRDTDTLARMDGDEFVGSDFCCDCLGQWPALAPDRRCEDGMAVASCERSLWRRVDSRRRTNATPFSAERS